MMVEASVMNIDTSKFNNSFNCSKTYTNPKTLPCLHSYLECLKTISETRKKVRKSFLLVLDARKRSRSLTSHWKTFPCSAFEINRKLEHHTFMQCECHAVHAVCVKCEKCSGVKTKAVDYCIDRSKFICDLCFQIHTSWSELQAHKTW